MNASPNETPVRLTERLLTYWRDLKQARNLPLESQVEPSRLRDIWDYCFLVRVDKGNAHEYTYSVLGPALVEAYGDDWTGKSVCESVLYPHPEPLFATFEKIAVTREPVTEENSFTNPQGLVVKYRCCMVPLAREEGGDVAYILGGMKWKAY